MELCYQHSLRSKRFRLVSEQRKTAEERDFRFWPREKWNEGLPALLLAPFFAPAVFDSRSSFFAPKPHGNVYYTS